MASGTIKSVVPRSDIVNNLTTNDSTKVLSAAQGYALNSKIEKAPVAYTSYADVKSGIASKAATMASGSIASFDFHANYSSAEELPGAYYTCILRKYDNNSYVADIISNVGTDYKLTYAGNTWRITSLSSKLTPTDYTTTGLNGNYCTFDRGGYCRIGNLVIVNIRVNISGSGANVTGFPAPKNIIGFGGYDGSSEKSAFGYMNTSGSLVIPTAYGNSGAVMFSFCYIT